MIKLGLVGFGHWGPNLLRNFLLHEGFEVIGLADRDVSRHESARKALGDHDAYITEDAFDIINDPNIDAVAIATPASSHYALAHAAIMKKKHVLVEKPLCTHSEEGIDLIARAKRNKVTLMVDHTILLTGAVQKIREVCNSGELGKICYFDATRINLGLFQKDVNVLWDLAPHDFSVVDYLFKDPILDIEASGYAHLNSQYPDIVYLTMHFVSNKIAHFNISWMSPIKMRHVVIGGTEKMLVWDDVSLEQKVRIYDSGITFPKSNNGEVVLPQYRNGPISCPPLSKREPLQNVIEHFANVIAGREVSLMDGHRGLRVVEMLERTQKALDKSINRVRVLREKRSSPILEAKRSCV